LLCTIPGHLYHSLASLLVGTEGVEQGIGHSLGCVHLLLEGTPQAFTHTQQALTHLIQGSS